MTNICKSNDLTDLASHRAIDVARNLLGSSQYETIYGHDIAAGHAEARVTEERLDG